MPLPATDEKSGFAGIIGRSRALRFALDAASRAAKTNSPVLIRGERGTGKELLARAIHGSSPRGNQAFVIFNCVTIPGDLSESELCGHVRGAFSGAVETKKGRAELADQGTLFFDEVGDLPPALQSRLLRVIERQEIEKIGADAPIRVDVRVIAATYRNLQALIEDGSFREDLYYKLSVVPLELPPLRERTEDIPALIRHFLERSKQKHNRLDLVLPKVLLTYFCSYRWPGNVGELEDTIEQLVIRCPNRSIVLEDLPEHIRRPPIPDSLLQNLPPHGVSLEAIERELILRALRKFNWNQTHAAQYLSLSRKTLMYRMEKFKLRREAEQVADRFPLRNTSRDRDAR